MIKLRVYIFIIGLIFFACRKEKAESPAPFLIGEWEFYYSYSQISGGIGTTIDQNHDNYHSIKVNDQGRVFVYDKDGLVEKGYIAFIRLSSEYDQPYKLYVYEVRMRKTSCFKKDYIFDGVEWIRYWPAYYIGPGGTKEQMRISTKEFKGKDYSGNAPEHYYKRKVL